MSFLRVKKVGKHCKKELVVGFCIQRPGWRPRLFGVFARTSGLFSTRDDLGESG